MKIILFHLKSYWPLCVVIILSSVLPLIALQQSSLHQWMFHMMGYFLVFLAMFKLFDVAGFKKGFAKYDIVTQTIPAYGYIYPFIELGLGLWLLSMHMQQEALIATMIVMGVGGIGIIRSILKGQKLNCACMGNILSVPLSTISIIENFGMVVMSIWMLLDILN